MKTPPHLIAASHNWNEHHIKALERATEIDKRLAKVIRLLINKNIDLYMENAKLNQEVYELREELENVVAQFHDL